MSRDLAALLAAKDVVVLSGAGISTESGIPDYRGPTGATWRRHRPMTYQEFVGDLAARRRYWARSHAGWPRFALAEPNAGHRAVAALQDAGLVRQVVTQNVDGLHQRAGSADVVDLHGRLDRVICLDCGRTSGRRELTDRLAEANPSWLDEATTMNPDGDADIGDDLVARFVVVDCALCGGLLKPDVVFFGESVPGARAAAAAAAVDAAASLLVLGSSLEVFSGRRYVQRAAARGIPVAIVNLGPTRGDDVATVRVDAPLGPTLTDLLASSALAR